MGDPNFAPGILLISVAFSFVLINNGPLCFSRLDTGDDVESDGCGAHLAGVLDDGLCRYDGTDADINRQAVQRYFRVMGLAALQLLAASPVDPSGSGLQINAPRAHA